MVDIERVRILQTEMSVSIGSLFSESELEHVRVLVRLAVEFTGYLQSDTTGPLDPRYTCESIFGGVESFATVTRAYKCSLGVIRTDIKEVSSSMNTLKEQYLAMFEKFLTQDNPEKKCRLLLDLFKLQIVYAGMMYE